VKSIVTAVAAALLLSGCATQMAPVAGPVAAPVPTKYGWGYSEKAKAEMAATFGTAALKPADSRWIADVPTAGTTKMVISLSDQMAWVYRGEKKDHESPVGQFPILAKEMFHRSNRYSNAPMPFMLRLNRWGVALHGGVVPGYPASHGCIRLPMAFAKKLYGVVKTGDVIFIEG
jgi:hypothetical protein